MIIERQSHNSNVVQVLPQSVYQRRKNNRRYMPSLDRQYLSPKNYIHLNVSQISKSKQSVELNKNLMPESQVRRYQQSFDLLTKNHQWKISKNQANLIAKYGFQRRNKPSIIQSNDDRRPVNYDSMTLPLKSKHQSDLPLNSLKESKKQAANRTPIDKPSLFTMNRKQLRKCRMGQKKANYLNYRVINLFDSLNQKINTIRQQQGNTIMGLNLKEYLEKVGNSCWKLTEGVKSTHQTIHTETPSSKGGIYINESHSNSIEEINETVVFHRINKKNEAQEHCIIEQEGNQFQLKPWSTQEIAIG